jgi:carboxyl-terminal processing protease
VGISLGSIRRFFVGLSLLALPLIAAGAEAEPRVALVVGNSNYGGELGVLKNPVNDAKLIADSLRKVGFDVIEAEDADLTAMKRALSEFGAKLADAGSGATGLFFYAGHGLQVGGTNYLIPVHADIKREADVDLEAISADLVMKQMAFAESAVNIVILDACRNNPLKRGFRDVSNGLAEIRQRPRGTFISYSTAPGDVAADGSGANSPYSTALAAEIAKPGASINDVFQAVRGDVMKATDAKQVPWDSNSLTAPFYFAAAPATASTDGGATKASGGGDPALEIAFWNSIKDSNNPKDYEAYLKKFPGGTFADLAANKLDALTAGAAPTTQTNAEQTVVAQTGDAQANGEPAAAPLISGDQSLVGPLVVTTRGEQPPEQVATVQPTQPTIEEIEAAQLPPDIAAAAGVFARSRNLLGLTIAVGEASHDDNGNIVLQFTATNGTKAPIFVATFDLGIVATTNRGALTDGVAWINLPLCNVLSGCTDDPEDWSAIEPGESYPFSIALQETGDPSATMVNLSASIVIGALNDSQRISTVATYPLFFAAIPTAGAAIEMETRGSQVVDGIRYDIVQAQAGQPNGAMMLVMTNTTDRMLWVRLLEPAVLEETAPAEVRLKPRYYGLSACDAPSPTVAKCATKDPLLWSALPPGLPDGIPFMLPGKDSPIQTLDLRLRVVQAPGDLASGRKQATVGDVNFQDIEVRP